MTNYHLKPPADPLPYLAWQEKKEKRKKLLEQIGRRRAEMYRMRQNRKNTVKSSYF